jgi:hypothetical protein
LRFALKTSESLRVAGNFLRQEFQGDEATEAGVFGLVDHTHPATADFFDDAVVGDGSTNQGRGVLHFAHILGCARRQVNESKQGIGCPQGKGLINSHAAIWQNKCGLDPWNNQIASLS